MKDVYLFLVPERLAKHGYVALAYKWKILRVITDARGRLDARIVC